jgi:N-acetylmuramoyl-L-alanine amidase
MTPLWETAEPHPDWAQIEVMVQGDTLRRRWPARVGVIDSRAPPLVIVHDDTASTGATDSVLAGRLTPNGTYHWFFSNGTVARVSGRQNDQVRLQLSSTSVAWVDAGDVHGLPQGMAPPTGVSRPPRLHSDSASVTLRVPLPAQIPFRVDETATEVRLRVYGVAPDIDWIQYGGNDPFVELLSFEQATEDEVVFVVRLAEPVWGYRTRWENDDLLLEIRRPPRINPERPLRGRLIAVDPGHPPGGATGPTGLTEPSVTLAIGRQLKGLLEEAGARVLMIRDSERPVDLVERVRLAERADADMLVSIHANALPDGVNPFTNSGTSVYYYHPRSALLARELNDALVEQFRERDLGFGRGDLAVVRATWMPSALTEGLFMMLPEHEAILASPEGQRRYAVGVLNGIERFLRARVETQRGPRAR